MKSPTARAIFAGILVALLGPTLAHAQLSGPQVDSLREQYRADSTPELSLVATGLSLSAGWHCGSNVASQIVTDIKNGKEVEVDTFSRECQVDAAKLRLVLGELSDRTKKQLQKNEIIETPVNYSQFNIVYGQLTPLEKVETTGRGSCAEKARQILSQWEKSEIFRSPMTAMRSNTVVPCQISRRGDEKIGLFSCREWFMTSIFDFTTGEAKVFGSSDKVMTPDEHRRLRKMVRRDQNGVANDADLGKWLKADLEAGIHFFPMLTLQKGASHGTLEVRGIAGPEWQKGVMTPTGVGRSDVSKLPVLCSIKTEIKATATEPRAGRAF